MTALLVVVTFGALGLAGALLFYVLRLTREERDRSAARAAALTELIGESGPDAWSAADGTRLDRPGADVRQRRNRRQRTTPGWLLVPAIGVVVVGLALTGIYVWNRPDMATAAAPAPAAPCRSNWSRCGTSARAIR